MNNITNQNPDNVNIDIEEQVHEDIKGEIELDDFESAMNRDSAGCLPISQYKYSASKFIVCTLLY